MSQNGQTHFKNLAAFDTRAVTRANEEKGRLGGWWKARPKVKLRGLISPAPNLNNSSRINFTWFNIINLDWFFLPSVFNF